MKTYIFIGILIIVVVAVIINNITMKSKVENTKEENKIDNNMPYNKKLLLTKNEWTFYKNIKPVCDKNNIHIISKVRLADIIEVKKDLEYKEKQKYFNKIKNKHIDFILCKPENLAIIALVELDDKSHERKDRIESDNFKNKLFETVGYKLIRATKDSNFENLLKENGIIENDLEEEKL